MSGVRQEGPKIWSNPKLFGFSEATILVLRTFQLSLKEYIGPLLSFRLSGKTNVIVISLHLLAQAPAVAIRIHAPKNVHKSRKISSSMEFSQKTSKTHRRH